MTALSVYGEQKEPYQGSRLFWDLASRTTVFTSASYARMIQLHDGTLMAVSASGGNIVASTSSNLGTFWSTPSVLFRPPSGYHYYDAELVQLSDGSIIVTYNIGPIEPYSDDRRFGVLLNISNDNGKTWTNPIRVYTAGTDFHTGCWEPAILEMPSGELHLYVSDESPFPNNYDQCIQLARSYDRGYTWTSVETLSYRPGTRDGMPVPLIVGDSIVVTIEDNGWPGAPSFVPVTIRSSLADNWKNIPVGPTSRYRSQVIDYSWCEHAYGGAPYMCLLPWGETVLSRQSYHESNNYDVMNMYVYVGDKNARHFKSMSQPFPDNKQTGVSVEWNSIAVIDTGIVCALGGVGSKGSISPRVDIVKGYPIRQFMAYYGTPSVDGTVNVNEYHYRSANQVKMGSNTIGFGAYADFSYDERNLYFVIRVADRTDASGQSPTDAVRLLLDVVGASDTKPVEGTYYFYMKADGTLSAYQGKIASWKTMSQTDDIDYQLKRTSSNYTMEIAIPWHCLGESAPPMGRNMRMAVEIQDRRGDEVLIEKMPDVVRDESWTWMNFVLEPHDLSAIASPETETVTEISRKGDALQMKSDKEIRSVELWSADGKLLVRKERDVRSLDVSPYKRQVVCLKILHADGTCEKRKLSL